MGNVKFKKRKGSKFFGHFIKNSLKDRLSTGFYIIPQID